MACRAESDKYFRSYETFEVEIRINLKIFMQTLRDIKHALRMFRESGVSFVVTAVVALGLGIGANTAIFSLVNAVLLKEPPFRDSSRIVILESKSPQGENNSASPAKFAFWAHQTQVVEDVAAFNNEVLNWTGTELPIQLRAERVSSRYFPLFGVPFLMGRPFNAQEDAPHSSPAVAISEGLWTRRFGRDPAIVGKTMLLGGEPYVITGVVSERFDFQDFGAAPEIWVPFQLDPNSPDQGHYFQAAARLEDGVSLTQAVARLSASTRAYVEKFPNSLGPKEAFGAIRLQDDLVRGSKTSIAILMGAVGFVLLIACSNVANLLLARAESRKRELAIRAALGAGRGRIIRQLMTESLLLGAAGAALGVLLGYLGIHGLLSVNTAGLPRIGLGGELVRMDGRVLLFTLGLTLLTTILFGLFPALQATRSDLSSTMKESASRSGSGLRQNRTRAGLVITEVALAVVLLVGAGLLIRTATALYSVKPGFETKNILTMRMSLSGKNYLTSAAIDGLVRRGVERIEAIPGVEMATATCCVPLENGYGLPFRIMGRPLEKGPFHGGGDWKTVSPGFFEAFHMRMLRGRTFNLRDTAAATPVVIITETMAKRFWPKGDPLQDSLLIGKGVMPQLETERPRQIIGVVGDVRDNGLNQDPGAGMYLPNAQVPDAIQALNVKLTPLAWVIKTKVAPMTLRSAVEEQLRQVSGLPVSEIRTMEETVSRSTSRTRFQMLLMSVFGGVSLFLAAIGIYGLMAYSVEQQTQEIGIRMALGAEPSAMRGMVLKKGLLLAVSGILVGLAAAYALAKQLESFVFGVTVRDPLVFITIPLVLGAIAVIAVWWPAQRATRVDPAVALRQS
jgi:putative ABC transport system permease protein